MGLDDSTLGIHLFRTAADRPAVAADFTGRDGCVAGTTGCQGIGGDGAGQGPALGRIFDAKVITTAGGTSDVYLTAGDGSAPVRLLTLPE